MVDRRTVGFVGPLSGMSHAQHQTVRVLLDGFHHLRHGDCRGSDEEAHTLARDVGAFFITVHPPIVDRLRAFCAGDHILDARPFAERSRDIVFGSDTMIGAPGSFTETNTGSTWGMLHLAQRLHRELVIVWPDGSTEWRCSSFLR